MLYAVSGFGFAVLAAPLHGEMEYQLHYLSPRIERAAARCGSTTGISYGVKVDPDGRVFDAYIASSKSSDATLQQCVVEALRKLELDPPPEGASGVGVNAD